MADLLEALCDGPILGDGDFAAVFGGAGNLPCLEAAVLLCPERVAAVHTAFLEAGARVIRTCSKAASRAALGAHGLSDHANELTWLAAQIARSEAKGFGGWVAGSVGPLPRDGDRDALVSHIGGLLDGGCDLISLEGFTDLESLLDALHIKNALHHCPAICWLPAGAPSAAIGRLIDEGCDIVGLPHMDRLASDAPAIALAREPSEASLPASSGTLFFGAPASTADTIARWAHQLAGE